MKFPWNFFRGRGSPAPKVPARTVPLVEVLEDRLVLSTIGPINNPAANDWRGLTFQIDSQVPTNTNVGTVTSQSMEDAQLIGLPQVLANYSYRGTGYTVAVIDTGIDYNNPNLGGGWGNRVIGGWNFVANNSNPMDDNGHGTFVAGIIGSSNATYEGIAPNVNFVALKVLDSTGSGTFGNVDLALQWVAAHQAQYNIVAVNMSLGSGNYTSDPFTFLESDFQTLVKDNIFISVAAGNSYYTYSSAPGLAYPAVSPSVVSVGATWDGNYGAVTWVNGSQDYTTAPGLITSFTQRDASLDILAPGAMITSETLNNQFATEAGTSMSTPVITGAAVLLHQALDSLGEHSLTGQQSLLSIMQNTGTSVVDGNPAHDNVVNTGLTFKSLNLFAALNSLKAQAPSGPTKPPVLGSLSNQTMTAGQSLVVNLSATDPAGLALQFSAQAVGLASQAYQLQQQYGLSYMGSYFYNSWGASEKWLLGTGSIWYCLTPDGDLRKWAGTIAGTMLPSSVVANLGASYYNNPSLLWNAAAPSAPPVTLTVSGSQLTISAPSTYTGSFQVAVTVSDGHNSVTDNFQVTVNTAPAIPFPSMAAFSSSTGSGTILLPSTDASGHPFSYSASLAGSAALAAQYEKSLGLMYLGSYFQNLFGQNEKWLGGSGGQLYFLLADGELRKYAGSMAASLGAANLIATLDPADYVNPQLLLSPVQPTFQVTGNTLTVQYPTGYVGSFVVQVTVTDGSIVTTQNITVTVANSTAASLRAAIG